MKRPTWICRCCDTLLPAVLPFTLCWDCRRWVIRFATGCSTVFSTKRAGRGRSCSQNVVSGLRVDRRGGFLVHRRPFPEHRLQRFLKLPGDLPESVARWMQFVGPIGIWIQGPLRFHNHDFIRRSTQAIEHLRKIAKNLRDDATPVREELRVDGRGRPASIDERGLQPWSDKSVANGCVRRRSVVVLMKEEVAPVTVRIAHGDQV